MKSLVSHFGLQCPTLSPFEPLSDPSSDPLFELLSELLSRPLSNSSNLTCSSIWDDLFSFSDTSSESSESISKLDFSFSCSSSSGVLILARNIWHNYESFINPGLRQMFHSFIFTYHYSKIFPKKKIEIEVIDLA